MICAKFCNREAVLTRKKDEMSGVHNPAEEAERCTVANRSNPNWASPLTRQIGTYWATRRDRDHRHCLGAAGMPSYFSSFRA
jgi:hypothetical protein